MGCERLFTRGEAEKKDAALQEIKQTLPDEQVDDLRRLPAHKEASAQRAPSLLVLVHLGSLSDPVETPAICRTHARPAPAEMDARPPKRLNLVMQLRGSESPLVRRAQRACEWKRSPAMSFCRPTGL
jgi:hypothetical protein